MMIEILLAQSMEALRQTKEGFQQYCRSHALLRHLDVVKPLLSIPLGRLQDHEFALLSKLPFDITLEFWSVDVAYVLSLFPTTLVDEKYLLPVVEVLSFSLVGKPDTKKICILDILTVLCILFMGDWDDKMAMMFRWYNLNNTGLMEEDEHFLMLQRVGHCFRKLKFIGPLELTDDDAKFIALSARISFKNNNFSDESRISSSTAAFRPGMYLDDFLQWSKLHDVCQLLFQFMRVFQRLIDMLVLLDLRSEKLQALSMEKLNARRYSEPIPTSMSTSISGLVDPRVRVVYHGMNCISLIIPNFDNIDNLIGKNWKPLYIKIDKEVQFDEPVQKYVPNNIISRNKILHESTTLKKLKCCEKTYDVTMMRQVDVLPISAVQGNLSQIPMMRTEALQVNISQLELNSTYKLTIFNERKVFRSVRINNHPNYMSVSADKQLHILPSTVDEKRFRKLTASVGQFPGYVYTGTVGNFREVCKFL
jgi:hypothetical protein